jgi:hypothetical protein
LPVTVNDDQRSCSGTHAEEDEAVLAFGMFRINVMGYGNRRACGSLKTVRASSNQIPCLLRLPLFFRSSQSNRSISR